MNAYPVAGKQKSADLCRAFIEGCGNAKGSVFYGIDQTNLHHWQRVRADGSQTYWYIDNSYFDQTRGTYFRITKAALQHSGQGETSGQRFKALEIEVKPWRKAGEHIVVCPQSDSFMREIVEWKGDWLSDAVRAMTLVSNRSFKIRNWDRDKSRAMATLPADLRNAWILATHSSAAAITALAAGIPVACIAGAAQSMAVELSSVEYPIYPEDRERFFGVLADNQFTLSEIKDGTAWRMLQRGGS